MQTSPNIFMRRVERRLDELGWTQVRLVKELGIAHSTFTRWKGGAMPGSDTVKKLAGLLQVSVDELLEGIDDDAETHIVPVRSSQAQGFGGRAQSGMRMATGAPMTREEFPARITTTIHPPWEEVQATRILHEMEACALQLSSVPEPQRDFIFSRIDRLFEDFKRLCVSLPFKQSASESPVPEPP